MNRMLAPLAAAAAIVVSSAAAQPARTAYEVDVSAPGTKSQGLRGSLYDEQGRPVGAGPLVQTPIGGFRWVACRMLWDTCGWWRDGSVQPRSTYPRQNRSVLRYRVSYETRGGRTRWRGELVGLSPRTARTAPVETPMGRFRWTSGQAGAADWQGWVPEGWPDLPLVPAR